MSSRRLMIYGAGGHGRVVADAARAAGWEIAGWADGDPAKHGREVCGAPVLATSPEDAAALAGDRDLAIVVALGGNALRLEVFETLRAAGATLATVVHPRAVVAASARLGDGTVVFAGAVINPDARIGANVIVNTAATIDHDCRIGDHVHISPGAHLGGEVRVGELAHLGLGAAVRNGISIGSSTVVGAGAVVVADLPAGVVAYGVPAKVVGPLAPEAASPEAGPAPEGSVPGG